LVRHIITIVLQDWQVVADGQIPKGHIRVLPQPLAGKWLKPFKPVMAVGLLCPFEKKVKKILAACCHHLTVLAWRTNTCGGLSGHI
jgi:hypothetical protein